MGDPKKPSKKYVSPRNPWRADMLVQDLHYLGTYGLRNKRELWRTQTELSRIRKQARQLLAQALDSRTEDEKKFIQFLAKNIFQIRIPQLLSLGMVELKGKEQS